MNLSEKTQNACIGLAAILAIGGISYGAYLNGAFEQKPAKIAVVDYQELLQDHPSREAAEEEMRKAYQDFQKQAQELRANSENQQQDQTMAMFELQKQAMEKQNSIFQPIKDDVDQKIDEVLKEKGYTFVFSRGTLLRGGDDLTVDVLRKEGVSDEKLKLVEGKIKASEAAGNK